MNLLAKVNAVFSQGSGECLNNKPIFSQPFDDILPGVIFDLDEQCRLALGQHSTYCYLGDEPTIVPSQLQVIDLGYMSSDDVYQNT